MLNLKEQNFARNYIINGGNAYIAALDAGYTKYTSRYAYEWLLEALSNSNIKRHLPYKPELVAFIDDELARIDSAKIADEKEILEYLTSVMRREKTEHTVAQGKGYAEIVETPTKVTDANKAAELLGKVKGLFRDKVSLDIVPVVLEGYEDVQE